MKKILSFGLSLLFLASSGIANASGDGKDHTSADVTLYNDTSLPVRVDIHYDLSDPCSRHFYQYDLEPGKTTSFKRIVAPYRESSLFLGQFSMHRPDNRTCGVHISSNQFVTGNYTVRQMLQIEPPIGCQFL